MTKAEQTALAAYPCPPTLAGLRKAKEKRNIFIAGYEQAEKDIWDRIEKYLKTRHHMDYATVGWILNNLEYYKQKIMEED